MTCGVSPAGMVKPFAPWMPLQKQVSTLIKEMWLEANSSQERSAAPARAHPRYTDPPLLT